MNADIELVTTGSELLNGRTVNRHAQVLGDHLHLIGLRLVRDTTVGDDVNVIRDAVASAMTRVDVVVVTGGLGPTCDDVTREAVAALLGRGIVMDPGALEAMRERYRRMNRRLTELSERQACIVEGSVALPNPAGAAPGQILESGGKVVFILPGPPREFLAVLEGSVLPWLRRNVSPACLPAERNFLICGIGESDIVARLEQAGFLAEGMEVAYSAKPGRIELRLLSSTLAQAQVDEAAVTVRRALGDFIYSEERLEMEDVVGRLLAEQGTTLATAESCTGGLIGHRITSVSGSSRYYLGGVIAYSNEAKVRELAVSAEAIAEHGAVSGKVAAQMAAGVRAAFGSDFGLGITGVAGPTGGTPDKPVGLVYAAVADRDRSWVRRFQFASDRTTIQEWSAQLALDLLRRRLLGRLTDEG